MNQSVRDLLDVIPNSIEVLSADFVKSPQLAEPRRPVCIHSFHESNVNVHRTDMNGQVTWTVEVSIICSMCGSAMLLNGRKSLRLEAKHER